MSFLFKMLKYYIIRNYKLINSVYFLRILPLFSFYMAEIITYIAKKIDLGFILYVIIINALFVKIKLIYKPIFITKLMIKIAYNRNYSDIRVKKRLK
jgi:hypothetical protein